MNAPVLTPGRLVDLLIEADPVAPSREAVAAAFGVSARTVSRLVENIRLRWGIPVQPVKIAGDTRQHYRLVPVQSPGQAAAFIRSARAFSRGPKATARNSSSPSNGTAASGTPGGAA